MTYTTSAARRNDWGRARGRSSYWMLYFLVLVAVACLPLSIRASGWVPEADRLIWPAFWGLAVGFVIAQARVPDWMTWVGSMVLGIEYSLQYAAKLAPSFGTLLGDFWGALQWLWRAIVSQQLAAPLPFSRSAAHVTTHVVQFNNDLYAWLSAVRIGAPTEDITALWIIVSLAVWLLSWHAGYDLIRHRRPFSALVPLGVAIVSNVSFTDVGLVYVHVYLAITLLTLVIANIDRLERLWQRLGLDFSPELRRDTLLAGGGIAVVVLVIALLMPYKTMSSAVWFFWDRVGPTMEELYDRLDKAFAGRDPVPEPTPDLEAAGLGGHSLVGSGEPGEDVVFTVQVSDPAPPTEQEMLGRMDSVDLSQFVPKRYWRERTFDVYTGSGWETSSQAVVEIGAGEDWGEAPVEGQEVTQTFALAKRTGLIAPAVNLPLRIEDQDYGVVTRNEGDLAALLVDAAEYTVVSVAPDPSRSALVAAEGPYPDWVADTYLDLPEIPAEVRDLAEQIVQEAEAVTRYDKAVAIQSYLRQYLYDLEVEPPELDQDVVAYFLFETQRGYCDYSATAMVVMLRSVGVASRYAQGYGQGTFDHREGVYVVRDSNRHAWPEVYFPGAGWIEFEPTPIQSVWPRAGSASESGLQIATSAAETEHRGIPRILLWGAVLAAVVALVIIWPFKYLRRQPADRRQAVRQVYARVLRAGRRLRLEPRGGQTPGEYLSFLARAIEERAGANGEAASDIGLISSAYQRAMYSDRELPSGMTTGVEAAWTRLQAPLRRAWFWQFKRRQTAR